MSPPLSKHTPLLIIAVVSAVFAGVSTISGLHSDEIVDFRNALFIIDPLTDRSQIQFPFGVLTGEILAIFFYLFSPSYGFIVATALGAVLFGILAYHIMSIFVHDTRYAFGAGLLSGAFIFSSFGLFSNHLAFALCLFAIYIRLINLRHWWLWSALIFVCAFHAKIPMAMLGMIALGLAVFIVEKTNAFWNRRNYYFVATYFLLLGTSLLFAYAVYGKEFYLERTFTIPLQYTIQLGGWRYMQLVVDVIFPYGMYPTYVLDNIRLMMDGQVKGGVFFFYITTIPGIYLTYYLLYRNWHSFNPTQKMATISLVYLTVCVNYGGGQHSMRQYFITAVLLMFALYLARHTRIYKWITRGVLVASTMVLLVFIYTSNKMGSPKVHSMVYTPLTINWQSCMAFWNTTAQRIQPHNKVAFIGDNGYIPLFIVGKIPTNKSIHHYVIHVNDTQNVAKRLLHDLTQSQTTAIVFHSKPYTLAKILAQPKLSHYIQNNFIQTMGCDDGGENALLYMHRSMARSDHFNAIPSPP